VARAREAAHVRADLGQDRLGRPAADARDRLEPHDLGLERAQPCLDLGRYLGDQPVDRVEVPEEGRQQEALVRTNPALERLEEGVVLVAQPARARAAIVSGSTSPPTRASSIARPEVPTTSEATEASLMFAPSRTFWIRLTSAVRC
jgi:hypothetical protein